MKDKEVKTEKIKKYWEITSKALDIARRNVAEGKAKEADEIVNMVSAYLSDAKHFEKLGHHVNAFAAINYAHGWLDCGARLKIFTVKNTKLFTI